MAKFGQGIFNGMTEKLEAKKIPENMASYCENIDFGSGSLRALKAPFADGIPSGNSLSLGTWNSTNKTIFKRRNGSWMTFANVVDVVESPIPNDQYERIYVTESGSNPKIYNGQNTANVYTLGVPKPSSPPTVVADAATTLSDVENPVSRAYTISYVTAFGEEGPPADVAAADIKTVYSDQTMQITFGNAPSGYNISRIRVYRTDADGVFRFVADYANNGAGNSGGTPIDDISDSQLGEENPSSTWIPPSSNMVGLTDMGNGILAGFEAQNLYFCERYLPHAWPSEYRLTVKSKIVKLATLPTGLLVLTEGKPYLAQGVDPAGITLTELDVPQACVSAQSAVDMGDSVFYASPDGLIEISASSSRNLTEGIFDKEQWSSVLNGSGSAPRILGGRHEGRYVALYNNENKGFIFDPRGGKDAFTFIDGTSSGRNVSNGTVITSSSTVINFWQTPSAVFTDPVDESLYFNGQLNSVPKLFSWEDGADTMGGMYQSKAFYFPRPINASIIRVVGQSKPINADIVLAKIDGTAGQSNGFQVTATAHIKATGSLPFNNAFGGTSSSPEEFNVVKARLPSGYKTHTYRYSIYLKPDQPNSSLESSEISFIEFAESPSELS